MSNTCSLFCGFGGITAMARPYLIFCNMPADTEQRASENLLKLSAACFAQVSRLRGSGGETPGTLTH